MPVQDTLLEATGTQKAKAAKSHKPIPKRAISAPGALNEAPRYGSAFSRGLRLDIKGMTILLISGTASVDEVDGIVNAVIVGAVVSVSVIVTEAARLVETFPAASFAHAYSVLTPAAVNVWAAGGDDVQPAAPADGADADSVAR